MDEVVEEKVVVMEMVLQLPSPTPLLYYFCYDIQVTDRKITNKSFSYN